jgi:tRNA-Thr(GGU) m(6)t(6)A37 methyltransferase TsaA
MNKFEYQAIGIIHTPHKTPEGTPIQASGAKGVKGQIEIYAEYAAGLSDLEGFSHIFILYHFHLSKRFRLTVRPFLDSQQRGVFATRAPSRPNPIGLSVVRLVAITDGNLTVEDVDVVDGTPLLDIKPYVPEFDALSVDKIGWLAQKAGNIRNLQDDGRFSR